MRIFIIFSLIIALQPGLYAQESPTENLKELTDNLFKYPAFVDGKIILKDGSEYAAKLNYNRILGKFLVIDRMGQTRPFANPDTLNKIIVAKDTFYYSNKSFLQKITHFPNINLYLKQTISYIEKQKGNNNGMPVVISNDSKLPYSLEQPKTEGVTIEKNSLFKLLTEYFIADSSLNFYPATRKNFYVLLPNRKNELKTFMRDHSVNFNNIEQMEQLLQYVNAL